LTRGCALVARASLVEDLAGPGNIEGLSLGEGQAFVTQHMPVDKYSPHCHLPLERPGD